MNKTYHISEDSIAHYICHRASEPLSIDGNLDKEAWKKAPKSRRFVDLVSGAPGLLDTRMAGLWDDDYLYFAFWLEEPALRATFTERDSWIWLDNNVEFFLDGDDCYYELQVNAFNTILEVFYVYQDALKKGSRFDKAGFDLYTRDVDVLSGFQDPARYGRHHRGRRWAFMDYDFPGLKTAVRVNGKINDPTHIDGGWTVEMALPWEGIKPMFARRSFPPAENDTLRAAFFRFEALSYHSKTIRESLVWALNAHGIYDCHIPENFSYLHFTNRPAGGDG